MAEEAVMEFAKVDERGEYHGLAIRGTLQASAISGYTGYLPGNDQAFGVNYGIQKKMTVGLLNSERRVENTSKLPKDAWGNPLVNSEEVKQQLANMYLKAVDPARYADLDMFTGVGKPMEPPDAPKKHVMADPKEVIRNPILAANCKPFIPHAREPAPAKIVGYAGFRPGMNDQMGMTVNKEYYVDEVFKSASAHSSH